MKIREMAEIIWPATSSYRHSHDCGIEAGCQMIKQFCDLKKQYNADCDRETMRAMLLEKIMEMIQDYRAQVTLENFPRGIALEDQFLHKLMVSAREEFSEAKWERTYPMI